jgi:TFIIF-interacting CTD phosphatase-like protein
MPPKEKKTIILDLDETLINSVEIEEYEKIKDDFKSERLKSHNMEDYYKVFERPYLQKFLDYVFKHFNVIIWTAASKDYAIFIIKHIILAGKNRNLKYIFFKYHCDTSKKYQNGSKNLKLLSDNYEIPYISENGAIIIDDYDEVHQIQPGNCVIAIPFEYENSDSVHDDFLLKLIPVLDKFRKSKSNRPNPAVKMNKALKTIS